MNNHLVWPSLNSIYKASKNTTWRKQVLDKRIVILRFLKENNLLTIDPFDENGMIKADLDLMRSDVTDIGHEMFKNTIPNWQKARDRDGNFSNTGILEKGLEKIIKARNEC